MKWYGEIICDGNHSTTTALYNFFNAKGPDYGIMITDALMAKGYEPGSKFIFGGNEIAVILFSSDVVALLRVSEYVSMVWLSSFRYLAIRELLPFPHIAS